MSHLNTCSCHLSDFLYLCSSFSNEGSALRGGNNESKCDGGAGGPRGGHKCLKIFLKLGADQGECLEDGRVSPRHCDNPLWTGAISDINLGSTLNEISNNIFAKY